MAETGSATATASPKPPSSVTLGSGNSAASQKFLLSPNGNIVVWVEGRINQVNRVAQTKDGRPIFETVVLLPAVDNYSSPRRYCVSSYGSLGRPGDDIAVDCELVCQPWRPRTQRNNQQQQGNYNDGYAGNNNSGGNGNDNGSRWHYPHYLWALR